MTDDILTFSNLFNRSTNIPLVVYDTITEDSTCFPANSDFRTITDHQLEGFYNFRKSPDYFIADCGCCFGFIIANSINYFLIVGPVFSTPASETTIRDFMHEMAISPEHRDVVSDFLCSIPNYTFPQFLQTLAYLNYCINDEVIDPISFFEMDNMTARKALSSIHSESMITRKENELHHNTYHFERQMLTLVQNGETNKLKELLSNSMQLNEGLMADNALRQQKNILISLATIVSRSAIAGGMDVEQAFQLSDVYVQDCEKSHDITYISNLSYSMLMDFTERVAAIKLPGGMSQEIFDCVQYITRNVNAPIQVGDVAGFVGRSRSYLSRKFKEELGFDISCFIMRCKLEEAKSLLTYTDKSLSEISSYLCFSTQAYFQNVFRNKYGLTPNAYRKKTKKL
ncbi:MAG: helix-turn-helix domain-containing protein [Blautia sp.]|nr:helix-turn-helix domain-containing protein [Blautia sp.]